MGGFKNATMAVKTALQHTGQRISGVLASMTRAGRQLIQLGEGNTGQAFDVVALGAALPVLPTRELRIEMSANGLRPLDINDLPAGFPNRRVLCNGGLAPFWPASGHAVNGTVTYTPEAVGPDAHDWATWTPGNGTLFLNRFKGWAEVCLHVVHFETNRNGVNVEFIVESSTDGSTWAADENDTARISAVLSDEKYAIAENPQPLRYGNETRFPVQRGRWYRVIAWRPAGGVATMNMGGTKVTLSFTIYPTEFS